MKLVSYMTVDYSTNMSFSRPRMPYDWDTDWDAPALVDLPDAVWHDCVGRLDERKHEASEKKIASPPTG